MKIGIDVRSLMDKNYSGVGWYTFNILKSLFELDKQNQYLLFYNSAHQVELPKFEFDNVKYVGFNYPNKIFNLVVNFVSWPKIDKLVGGVDVFLVPNFHFISLTGVCNKVVVVHDLSFLQNPEFFSIKMWLWHKLILAKNILKSADVIVADSISTKRDLIELLNISVDKIKVIYLGVDDKYQRIIDDNKLAEVRNKYGLKDKFIFYLGTLEPRKNIESIIEAYNQMDTDHQLVIGGGQGWKTDMIYKLAKENANIKLIGYIDELDKPAVYSLASCLVYPSYYEGFGLPLLEAMACGCPVICGNNSSQGEIVADAGLIINPYNINEIKKAMELIIENKDFAGELASRGLKRSQNFSWDKTAKQVLEILKTI